MADNPKITEEEMMERIRLAARLREELDRFRKEKKRRLRHLH